MALKTMSWRCRVSLAAQVGGFACALDSQVVVRSLVRTRSTVETLSKLSNVGDSGIVRCENIYVLVAEVERR